MLRQIEFLVSSREIGLQAMIIAACEPDEKIILSRDLELAVINGLILSGAIPIYLESNNNLLEQLKSIVTIEAGISAVFLNNAFKDEDINAVMAYCHEKNIRVLLGGDYNNFADMALRQPLKDEGNCTKSCVLVADEEGIDPRLVEQSILLVDPTYYGQKEVDESINIEELKVQGEMILSPRDAYYAKKEIVALSDAVGRIAGESIINKLSSRPIVNLGEVITEDCVAYIQSLKEGHIGFLSSCDKTLTTIKVVTTKKYVKRLR